MKYCSLAGVRHRNLYVYVVCSLLVGVNRIFCDILLLTGRSGSNALDWFASYCFVSVLQPDIRCARAIAKLNFPSYFL